jgi:Acetyltransferase (GNAT) domain
MKFELLLELDLISARLDGQCGKGWVGSQQGQCRRATKAELQGALANKSLHMGPIDTTNEAAYMATAARRNKTIDKLEEIISKRWSFGGGLNRAEYGKSQALNSLRQGKNPDYGLIAKTNDQGQPVGFLSYKPGRGRNVVLQSVGTDQSVKGAGRAMFEDLAKVAIKSGKGIEVSAGDDAIEFYKKMGMSGSRGDLSMSADEVRAKYGKKTDSVALQRIQGRRA